MHYFFGKHLLLVWSHLAFHHPGSNLQTPPSTNTLPVSCSVSICHYDPSLAWRGREAQNGGKYSVDTDTQCTIYPQTAFKYIIHWVSGWGGFVSLGVCMCACVRVNVINRIFRWWAGILNFQSEPANSKDHDADSWPLQAKQRKKENPKSSWWFPPIWKICSSTWIISPGFGRKIKNNWNHHLEIVLLKKHTPKTQDNRI